MDVATGGAMPRDPTLPIPDSMPPARRAADRPPLADGCYLIRFTPTDIFAVSTGRSYDGTLRVETTTGRVIASGDLYQRLFDANSVSFGPPPDPKAGIPVFPIDTYRFYMRVTDLVAADGGFALTFEPMRFSNDPEGVSLLNGNTTFWLAEDPLTARMRAVSADDPPPDDFPPPDGFPSPELCFVGDVVNRGGTTIGTLQMGFVSRFLRRATIEIDRVPYVGLPLDNGAGEDWKTIFAKFGWDVSVSPSDSDIVAPSGPSWSKPEARATMLSRRTPTNLDAEWHYYVLCVQRIDLAHSVIGPKEEQDKEKANGERGYMFSEDGGAINHPREGLMVAADWNIPDTPQWGLVRGKLLGETVAYFRTAVHEMGHAMGLSHNIIDNGFMNPTENVAADSLVDHGNGIVPFPGNIPWSFSPDDSHRLRHWPDLVVRPGTVKGPESDNAPVSSFASDHYRLEVTPAPVVSAGMPVHVELELVNVIRQPLEAPPVLSVAAGSVRGRVIDPSGTTRTFSLPRLYEMSDLRVILQPGEAIKGQIALLEGAEGELFSQPGVYRLVVEATWRGPALDASNDPNKVFDIIDMLVIGEAQVTVQAAPGAG